MLFKILLKTLLVVTVVSLTFSSLQPVFAESNLHDSQCPDFPTGLKQGDIAIVAGNLGKDGLNLRVQPGLNEEIIIEIPSYSYVTVIAGFRCQDGYRWYEIGFEGHDGWAAEVGLDGFYYLIPNGQPMPVQEQTVPTQSDRWPDSFIGLWKGNGVTCWGTSQSNEYCSLNIEISRDSNGNLITSEDLTPGLISEQGRYKALERLDGTSQYFYCFDLYQVQNGEYWGERCVRQISDTQIEVDETSPRGGAFGILTLVNLPLPTPTPVVQGNGVPTLVPQATEVVNPKPFAGQDETVEPTVTQEPVAASERPFWCSWPIIGWLTCDLAEANSVGASTNTECSPQCVIEARAQRDDLYGVSYWTTAGRADTILADAKASKPFMYKGIESMVRIRNGGESPQAGDLVIWPWGEGGVWAPIDPKTGKHLPGGHIGYVTASRPGYITVHDANWDNHCSIRDKEIKIESYMRFITSPYPTTPNVSVPKKCDSYSGWQNFACQYIPWWKP